MLPTATILARGYFNQTRAKTAHGLIRHGRKYKIISVIDETLAGQDAGEIMGLGKKGIPIVEDIDTSAEILIIGVAPSGGQLPLDWRQDIIKAIENGIDVVSGLHEFLNDDPEFAKLAKKYNVSLIDVRKSPDKLYMAQYIKPTVPVILFAGTDGRCGKRTTLVEIYNVAQARGLNPGFIATGQTGIMIGCDAGVAVDHLPTDFVAGAIEHAVQEVIKQGKDIILVEGQGALLHHAYSTSTIGILYGARPSYIILSHKPNRKFRASFPEIPMPMPEKEIEALELLSREAKVIALSLNCEGAHNYKEICAEHENRTGLFTVDVLADSGASNRLLDKITEKIENK